MIFDRKIMFVYSKECDACYFNKICIFSYIAVISSVTIQKFGSKKEKNILR